MDAAKVLGIVVDKVTPTDADGNTMNLAELAARAREERARREAAAKESAGPTDGTDPQ